MEMPYYPIPEGLEAIPHHLLDLRSDDEVDYDILNPRPVSNDKNIWFFWNTGFASMHPYTQRSVRTWHRRFSKLGWTVRVIDLEPLSPLNIAKFLDIKDANTFPQAFIDGTISGSYAMQHTSDLVRFPLLLKYGGVYTDVGMIQIGNLDRLWNETIGNPNSPFEVLSYNAGGVEERALTNYFLASRRNNPFFERCHLLLLALWAAEGGKVSTEGMHTSPLLKGIPQVKESFSFEENGRIFTIEETKRLLADYLIQCQAITMVMGLVDSEGDWDGPKYVAEHIYAIDYMVGSQLINDITSWNGPRQFELMSLTFQKIVESETEDQEFARSIVESCLQKSFGFKLAHGLIVRVLGETLGSLWKKNTDSDNVPGTYAHWLRQAALYWDQKISPPRLDFQVMKPFKVGPLLRND